MARQPRFFVPGGALHVIQRGNHREPIFAADSDFRSFMSYLSEASERHRLAIHAYVLMTNHIPHPTNRSDERAFGRLSASIGKT